MITLRPWFLRSCCLGLVLAWAGLASAHAAREGALRDDPTDELFTNTAIRHLRIEIGKEEMAILSRPVSRGRTGGERPSVPATVREGAFVWTNVSIHLKGSFGSFRPINDKPALTLNFDKLAENQRFHGLQKISLNNSVQDPSYVSEKICREIYAAAGVPPPRVDYATVELNGRPLGLFLLVEGWNKQFLRRHFPNAKGNFYELFGSRDVDRPLEATFGNDPTNHAALAAVAAATKVRDHTQRVEQLRAAVDLDRFVSLHALDVLMWNWDGYGMNRNNYRMFHDLAEDRMVILPHGVDQMFWMANGPIMTGRSGLVAKSLLETAVGRQLYLARFTELRTKVFDPGVISSRVAALTARLAPALKKQGLITASQQKQAAQEFTGRMAARARDVDAQLASVRHFTPLPLGVAAPLTNWTTRTESGQTGFSTTTNSPIALRVLVGSQPGLGVWTTTLWLEEGRYRIEGRIKTLGVVGDERGDGGAGFRVWSSRKVTRGSSWDWFPYSNSRDERLGGLLPVFTNAPQQRLTGDASWTTVTHEFELRQPLADVQIQCALQATAGAAWFDQSSLQIRRVAMGVSKSATKGN